LLPRPSTQPGEMETVFFSLRVARIHLVIVRKNNALAAEFTDLVPSLSRVLAVVKLLALTALSL
jgi:hypothetical protein